jgi:hypothetical protein
VSDNIHAAPNQRPPPEAIAARLGEVAARYEKKPQPFTGLADIRHREAQRLLRGRGLSSEERKAQINQISASIGFGSSARLSKHLKLLGVEKDRLHIHQLPAIDRTREEQIKVNRARDKDRKRAERKAVRPVSTDELQSAAILGALDQETWRSARDVDALLAECPAFKKVTSRASRKAIIRRAFGKMAAFGVIEVEDQMSNNGVAIYARLLPFVH